MAAGELPRPLFLTLMFRAYAGTIILLAIERLHVDTYFE